MTLEEVRNIATEFISYGKFDMSDCTVISQTSTGTSVMDACFYTIFKTPDGRWGIFERGNGGGGYRLEPEHTK